MKGFLDSPLPAIYWTCKRSPLIILNVLDFVIMKFCDFLQFLCKLNTGEFVKTCLFRLPRYYGDSHSVMFPRFIPISFRFPWCFPMFTLVLLWFPQVFLLFLLSVFPVSYFRFCENWSVLNDPAKSTCTTKIGMAISRLSFLEHLKSITSGSLPLPVLKQNYWKTWRALFLVTSVVRFPLLPYCRRISK